ncbi:MAG: DUF362 domain-containing protein [Bacilli bacterium]|nr:DUF362 domain-containing protein [Bacilli bacterium]
MEVYVKYANDYNDINNQVNYLLDNLLKDVEIKDGMSVFIKTNALSPHPKERAITTHPSVVKAIIEYLKKYNVRIIVGDNPATKEMTAVYKVNGTMDVIKETGVELANNKDLKVISAKEYKRYKDFNVSRQIVESDILINVPKLKTHGLAYFTGAQKNLFGTIYGLEKAQWHVKSSSPLEFGEAMSDLYSAIKEEVKDKVFINIMDGIEGLEGEGPATGGVKKSANVLLGSKDAIALDRVAMEIVKLDHTKSFISILSSDRGLGEFDLNNIDIIGDDLSLFDDVKFEPAKTEEVGIRSLKLLNDHKIIKNMVLEHPVFDKEKCIKCGECKKICPPGAICMEEKNTPTVNKKTCIRCWCCQEVCPVNAIKKSKRPLIGRIFFKR